jgi:hypothetical protein
VKLGYRRIAVAVVQRLIVLSLAGKYAFHRERLPRVWVKATAVDPNLPIRGRYVSLRLQVDGPPQATDGAWMPARVRLTIQDGHLVAAHVETNTGLYIMRFGDRPWTLMEPVAFFIPEHVPDPSRRANGEELWVEVSVPEKGPPRPLRLGVKKNGVLTPLELR